MHKCAQAHWVQQVPGVRWVVTVTVLLLISAFAWHSMPNAHTGSPHCCQAAGDSSLQWKVGRVGGERGVWLWKSWWKGRGGRGAVYKNTLNFRLQHSMCGYQTSLFVSRSQAGHTLEVGWRSALPHSYFIDNAGKKKKLVKAQFGVAHTTAELHRFSDYTPRKDLWMWAALRNCCCGM